MFRIRRSGIFPAVLVLMIGAGTLQATNLLTATLTPTSGALTCNTASGPGTALSVVLKPATTLSGSNTIVVSLPSLTGGLVATAPTLQTLSTSNQAAGLTYSVNIAAGCVGATSGSSTPSFRFNANPGTGAVADVTVNTSVTVVATTSGLSTSGAVALTCVRTPGGGGPTYTPGPAQTVSVTSAATGGTPFSVDAVTNPPANWVTLNPATPSGTATATAATFTAVAAAGCGTFNANTTNTTTIHLLNPPAPDKLITVSLQVLNPSPLVATPSPASLTYTKGSGSAGHVDVNVTSAASPAPFFAVDTTSLPIWLTVDSMTGTVPKALRFTSTSVADSLAPGTYSTTVRLKVSSFGDLPLPVSLLVTNPAPRLTTAEGNIRNLNWGVGQALPTLYITLVSTDSPIPYSITTGGTLAPIISANAQKGLAYSFGTPIGVTFDPLIFAAAQPGNVLTGTVTITWGTPASTIVVTFNITIQSAGATLTSVSPAGLPTSASGQVFTVVLTGSGFVPSTDPTQKTKVGIVVGGSIVTDTNIASNVQNASNIILTITVPVVADTYLPFSPTGSGGTVNLGVCNPSGSTCTVPTGTGSFTIGNNPIIQAVTSSSSFIQTTPGTPQSVSPYDILSIFGTNFCSSGGTGCNSATILSGSPSAATLTYPTSLSPDAAGSTQRSLTVKFQTHATPAVAIANAPLLFATNGQINLLVPSGVYAYIGGQVDIVVNFGYGSGTTMLSSTPYTVNVVATNPGIFTIGADGQGQGAILASNYALVTAGHEAGMRTTAADSDWVQIYMTGLGAPDSSATNGSGGSNAWGTDCIDPITGYLAALNTAAGTSLTTVDGTVMQSALVDPSRLVPCVTSSSNNVPSVTIGGQSGTVLYAGWVPDAIAGLYVIDVQLPGAGSTGTPITYTTAAGTSISNITYAVQLPVVVTANSRTSQPSGVTIWVAPRLKVAAPSVVSGTVGVAWAGSNNSVVATEGTATYRYALTSGLLPSGLRLNADGSITGTPAANTGGSYAVTVTATDSANVPVTGTVTFSVSIAAGLYMASTGTAPYAATFGTASASLTTVSATGGVYPYAYAITSPSTVPTGMTVGSASGIVGTTAATPASTYHVTIGASDATVGTALTGSITFDIAVALKMVTSGLTTHGTHGQTNADIGHVTATGNTGTISYALHSGAPSWLSIASSTGVLSTDANAVAGTFSITVDATDGTAAPGAASAGVGHITFSITID